jgi:hypothetical protein
LGVLLPSVAVERMAIERLTLWAKSEREPHNLSCIVLPCPLNWTVTNRALPT